MSIEAMKLALEALESCDSDYNWDGDGDEYQVDVYDRDKVNNAITALRQAIEQAQKQEPVVNYCRECLTYNGHQEGCSHYTTPPQQKQEPVAWMSPSWIDPDTRGWQSDSFESIPIEGWLPLYTSPPQRQPKQAPVNTARMMVEDRDFSIKPKHQWVGLTDEDWDEIFGNALTIGETIKVTEAKLKEKNNG